MPEPDSIAWPPEFPCQSMSPASDSPCRTLLSCRMISALFRFTKVNPLHYSKTVTAACWVRQLARLRSRRVQHPSGLARKPLGNLGRWHCSRTGSRRNPRICAHGTARLAQGGRSRPFIEFEDHTAASISTEEKMSQTRRCRTKEYGMPVEGEFHHGELLWPMTRATMPFQKRSRSSKKTMVQVTEVEASTV